MSHQTTTVTNRASVMHAVIYAWYMSGLISRSVYIAIANSGPRGPRYIGATLYLLPSLLQSFESNGLSVQDKTFKTNFQDGGYCNHLGFPIGTILAIFWSTASLDTSYRVLEPRFSRRSSHQNYFLPTGSLNTSYQVSSQLAFRFRRSSK